MQSEYIILRLIKKQLKTMECHCLASSMKLNFRDTVLLNYTKPGCRQVGNVSDN